MDWANVLEIAIPVFTVCGAFFLWLRQDNKRLEDKLGGQITQLRDDMNARIDSMEGRLRGVETEQAGVAGVLEGLALTGRLPE